MVNSIFMDDVTEKNFLTKQSLNHTRDYIKEWVNENAKLLGTYLFDGKEPDKTKLQIIIAKQLMMAYDFLKYKNCIIKAKLGEKGCQEKPYVKEVDRWTSTTVPCVNCENGKTLEDFKGGWNGEQDIRELDLLENSINEEEEDESKSPAGNFIYQMNSAMAFDVSQRLYNLMEVELRKLESKELPVNFRFVIHKTSGELYCTIDDEWLEDDQEKGTGGWVVLQKYMDMVSKEYDRSNPGPWSNNEYVSRLFPDRSPVHTYFLGSYSKAAAKFAVSDDVAEAFKLARDEDVVKDFMADIRKKNGGRKKRRKTKRKSKRKRKRKTKRKSKRRRKRKSKRRR